MNKFIILILFVLVSLFGSLFLYDSLVNKRVVARKENFKKEFDDFDIKKYEEIIQDNN